MIRSRPIGVAGAGSIGCFVGGMLAAGGRRVALLARPRVIAEIERNGLRLTISRASIRRHRVRASSRCRKILSIFSDAGVVLVTVKSADTAEIADIDRRHAPPDAVIVSLQNGVGNVAVLRERLPGRRVLGGMVPFNVIALGEGRFHRATSGDIVIEQDEAHTGEALSVPGLKMNEAYAGKPVYRFIPSLPVEVRQGAVVQAAGPEQDAATDKAVSELFAELGTLVVLDDGLVDVAMGLMSCAPAYVALVAEAQIDAGVRKGIPAAQGAELVIQTLAGTAELLRRRGNDTMAIRREVASPGGVTARGLDALERGGIRAAFSDALDAVLEKR